MKDYDIPGTQMTLVLVGKDLLFGGNNRFRVLSKYYVSGVIGQLKKSGVMSRFLLQVGWDKFWKTSSMSLTNIKLQDKKKHCQTAKPMKSNLKYTQQQLEPIGKREDFLHNCLQVTLNQMTLIFVGKMPCFGGLTFKNRGYLGS